MKSCGATSLVDISKLLQPKYTMHGFEWQDERGVEGTGFVRALRSLLTANLPSILYGLETRLSEALNIEVLEGPLKRGRLYRRDNEP